MKEHTALGSYSIRGVQYGRIPCMYGVAFIVSLYFRYIVWEHSKRKLGQPKFSPEMPHIGCPK